MEARSVPTASVGASIRVQRFASLRRVQRVSSVDCRSLHPAIRDDQPVAEYLNN